MIDEQLEGAKTLTLKCKSQTNINVTLRITNGFGLVFCHGNPTHAVSSEVNICIFLLFHTKCIIIHHEASSLQCLLSGSFSFQSCY